MFKLSGSLFPDRHTRSTICGRPTDIRWTTVRRASDIRLLLGRSKDMFIVWLSLLRAPPPMSGEGTLGLRICESVLTEARMRCLALHMRSRSYTSPLRQSCACVNSRGTHTKIIIHWERLECIGFSCDCQTCVYKFTPQMALVWLLHVVCLFTTATPLI